MAPGVVICAGRRQDVASGLREAGNARLCLLAEVEEKEIKEFFRTPPELSENFATKPFSNKTEKKTRDLRAFLQE